MGTANLDSSIMSVKKKRRIVLPQVLFVVGLLVVVWFSFGQNVLAPRKQVIVPEQLGGLHLVSSVAGSEAISRVTKLHGTSIELVDAYIAEYEHGGETATVWVGIAQDGNNAAELTKRMRQGIERGGAGFNNLRQLSVNGVEVFQVDGSGGAHFFYNSGKLGEKIVWLSVEVDDEATILNQVIRTF